MLLFSYASWLTALSEVFCSANKGTKHKEVNHEMRLFCQLACSRLTAWLNVGVSSLSLSLSVSCSYDIQISSWRWSGTSENVQSSSPTRLVCWRMKTCFTLKTQFYAVIPTSTLNVTICFWLHHKIYTWRWYYTSWYLETRIQNYQ